MNGRILVLAALVSFGCETASTAQDAPADGPETAPDLAGLTGPDTPGGEAADAADAPDVKGSDSADGADAPDSQVQDAGDLPPQDASDGPADVAWPDTADEGGSEAPDAGAVQCTGAVRQFPAADQACAVDADCVVAIHQVDCCGNRVAIGISASQKAAFDAAEAVCEGQYPACGCAEGPTKAEDGNSSLDPAAIAASCQGWRCASHVKGSTPSYAGIPCGFAICAAASQACCVTSPGQQEQCLAPPASCGADGFAAACDGPEDCGLGGSCCDPSGVGTWNACSKGACLAQELTVCHVNADCAAGYSCCPTVVSPFQGWAHDTCQPGDTCSPNCAAHGHPCSADAPCCPAPLPDRQVCNSLGYCQTL